MDQVPKAYGRRAITLHNGREWAFKPGKSLLFLKDVEVAQRKTCKPLIFAFLNRPFPEQYLASKVEVTVQCSPVNHALPLNLAAWPNNRSGLNSKRQLVQALLTKTLFRKDMTNLNKDTMTPAETAAPQEASGVYP
ncbi:hypothetical protein RUND412_004128 [Rhizina undulata]